MKHIRAVIFAAAWLVTAVLVAQTPTANLWIDTNGGTCTRQGTASSYVDGAACSSIQAALVAASNGDTVRVKAATSYGGQDVTATKGSPGVTVRCETSSVGACTFAYFDLTGASWIELKDLTFDRGDSCHNCGSYLSGTDHITLSDIVLLGAFQANWWEGNSNLVWNGGSMWSASRPSGKYYCDYLGLGAPNYSRDGIPLTITNTDGGVATSNMAIDGVTFWPMLVNTANCGADNYHGETIRVDGYVTNLLLDRLDFKDGREENTGTLFLTNHRATTFGTPVMSGIVVRNSYFGTAPYSFQTGGGAPTTPTGSCAITFEYNTFRGGNAMSCSGGLSGHVFRGNAGTGWVPWLPCTSGNHVKNVWQWSSTFTCGSDTVVVGEEYGTEALGIGSSGYTVEAGSPLIDAGESTCASSTGGVDILGNARPSGSACDAGAQEYGSGSAPPPAPTNFRLTQLLPGSVLALLGL